ncbi:MAG: VOC family protein [Bacteroidetes bacterium]|nr:VOC family protein [Bacteroidota bacterium]
MKHFTLFICFIVMSNSGYSQDIQLQMNHIALLVRDLDKSVDFYQQVLLLDEMYDGTEQPHIRWFSLQNGAELHLIEDKNVKLTQQKGVHFALAVNDLDAFVIHLKNRNIYFENWTGEAATTNSRPDAIRQVYLQDPDGYWIEVNGK